MKLFLGVAMVVGLGVSLVATDAWGRGPRGRGVGGGARVGAGTHSRSPGPATGRPTVGPMPTHSFSGSGFNRPVGPIRANNPLSANAGRLPTTFNAVAGGPRPFSPAWYAHHPKAWHRTHPHAGQAAVVVTAIGVTRWLAGGSGSAAVVQETTQYVEPTDDESDTSGDLLLATTNDDDQEWLPLGVFSLHPVNQTVATRVTQLSVNQDGLLRGSHFDLITNTTVNIQGNVDSNTGEVSWTIGPAGQVVFQANLQQLTSPTGQVTVRYPDGQTDPWQISRLEN